MTLDLAHPACMAYLIKYDLSDPICLVVAIFNTDVVIHMLCIKSPIPYMNIYNTRSYLMLKLCQYIS